MTLTDTELESLVGMTEEQAEGYLIGKCHYSCVNMRDGVEYFYPSLFDPRRVHIDVENNLVIKVNGVG